MGVAITFFARRVFSTSLHEILDTPADIKVGSFEPASPETIGSDIKTCTILSTRGGTCEGFSSNRLQFRLNTDITTYFSEEVGSRLVPNMLA